MEVNPLSVILVKSDSKGDRLLFRYPFQIQENSEPSNTRRKNPYTLPIVEDLLQSPPQPSSNMNKGNLTGFTDEVLSSLFAVKFELCNRKFELKVNDVRFVSHPTLLQLRTKQDDSGIMLINIVFALQALASHSVVKCYHDLSKRMGIVLKHEEKRCGYVSDQTQLMTSVHDDFYSNNPGAAFQIILEKCTLATNIKKMYDDLCNTGLVNIRVNRWIPLSFCLPQKVHQWHLRGKIVEPEDIDRMTENENNYRQLEEAQLSKMNDIINLSNEKKEEEDFKIITYRKKSRKPVKKCYGENEDSEFAIDRKVWLYLCLKALRPYHSLLLLHPIQHMNDFTSLDGSPSLVRMLSQYSPLKNLYTLAADADLTLSHVFELAAHLVYWAKATVIFPVCSTNKYVISPNAPIHLTSPLLDKFCDTFPGANLIRVISEFSLPTSLGQKCNPLCHPSQQSQLVQTIIWMLQHHLLLQLHTYVQYMPTDNGLLYSKM
ncbi:hypothetical protein NQ314_019904 [Rhamnusium bicolor]|uniref:GATOR complex protein NPRL3 n=2 Tax=Rhamnusium bicolor TaxID=1586634 RepID=A0AAV8WPG2_9CUCU|nr:hypothetical protein NQ314_019904 [Rhamnusium bicolor]